MYTFIDIHRMRQDTAFGAKQILRMRLLVIGTSKQPEGITKSAERRSAQAQRITEIWWKDHLLHITVFSMCVVLQTSEFRKKEEKTYRWMLLEPMPSFCRGFLGKTFLLWRYPQRTPRSKKMRGLLTVMYWVRHEYISRFFLELAIFQTNRPKNDCVMILTKFSAIGRTSNSVWKSHEKFLACRASCD
jgi:hypothetical protein